MPQTDKFSYPARQKRPAEPIGQSYGPRDTGEKTAAPRVGGTFGKLTDGGKLSGSGQSALNRNTSPPIQPIAERFPALEEQEVVLTFCAPVASVVQVAGSFNGWHAAASPLAPTRDGEWAVRLRLKSGRYEYRFVVDDVWADDPAARQSAANPHGGLNAVLTVGLADRTDFL